MYAADSDPQSVYKIKPWRDVPILGVAALGAAVPVLFQDKIVKDRTPGPASDVNSFDRGVIGNRSDLAAWTSHVTVAAAIAVPLYLDYKDLGWGRTLAEDAMVYTQVLSINSAVNNIARFGVQRPRPEAYAANPPPGDAGSYLSFYAGHVASTVAALSAASMTYGYRYGHRVWPWVVTGVAGVAEGAMRSAAGKHFYTDDIVGILAGGAIGTLVPMWHHREGSPPVAVVPERNGALLVWHRNF